MRRVYVEKDLQDVSSVFLVELLKSSHYYSSWADLSRQRERQKSPSLLSSLPSTLSSHEESLIVTEETNRN